MDLKMRVGTKQNFVMSAAKRLQNGGLRWLKYMLEYLEYIKQALRRDGGQQTTRDWPHALPTRTPLNHCPTFCVHDCFCWGSPFISSSLTSWFSGPFCCWSWLAPLVSIAASCPWEFSFEFSISIFSFWAASCFFSTRDAEATVMMPWMFTLTLSFTFCDSPSAVGWTSLMCHWPVIVYNQDSNLSKEVGTNKVLTPSIQSNLTIIIIYLFY